MDRAVLAGYALRALENAAGEPQVVRKIVNWLVRQESVLLLALPRALFECVETLRNKEIRTPEDASEFATCYAAHRDELFAALARPARSVAGQRDAISVNLDMLACELELNDVERGVLDIAARYTRSPLFESFCDSFSEPVVKVLADLLGASRQAILRAALSKGTLARNGLIEVNAGNRYISGSDGYVKILPWLDDHLDQTFADFRGLCDAIFGAPLEPSLSWRDYPRFAERDLIAQVLKGAVDGSCKGVNVLIYGPPGCGKTEFCKTLAAKQGLDLLSVGEVEDCDTENSPSRRLAGLALAERLLRRRGGTVLLFDEMEDLLGSPSDRRRASKLSFNRMLENNQVPVLWTCNDLYDFDPAFLRRMTVVAEMKLPEPRERARIWARMLENSAIEIPTGEVERLARRTDVAPAVAASALRAAELASGGEAEIRQALDGLSKALNDGRPQPLTAPDAASFDLSLVKADHDLVGLTASLEASGERAFSLCLSGPSGSGKSAYARHLARVLGLQVLQKRASDLLGRYIGDSEKFIARAFEEARESNAFLIFDEADSLLGDRREAARSWEVSQVNEMLTWMESHPLPFCCTTNLMTRLDTASLRRFTFNIKFDYLDRRCLKRACKVIFGPAFAARPDLLESLAALSNLTPGDFATVRRKASILGTSGDPAALSRLLLETSEAKPDRAVPIGFRC